MPSVAIIYTGQNVSVNTAFAYCINLKQMKQTNTVHIMANANDFQLKKGSVTIRVMGPVIRAHTIKII